MSSFQGGKDVGTSKWRRVPGAILPREIRPEHLKNIDRIIMPHICSKDVIPLLVDRAQCINRLVNNMALLIDDEVVGLILCLIPEVVVNIGTARVGRISNFLLPSIDAPEFEIMLALFNLTLEPKVAFMQ